MSFVSRSIEFSIALAEGKTGEHEGEAVTLAGYRSKVSIDQFGGASMGHAMITIYGLPLDLMKRLTTIGTIAKQIRAKNRIEVRAGAEGSKLPLVFTGVIATAWVDFQGMPDVSLNIDAYSAMAAAMESVTATSFNGAVSISDIMSVLAKKAGLGFVNHGVTGSLSSPAFRGSTQEQILACAEAAQINYSIDLVTLNIWPEGGHLKSIPVVVSPESGLVGYPSFSSQFVIVDCEFIQTLTVGSRLTIKDSQLGKMVDGTWVCAVVTHDIACKMPGGPWFTHAELAYRAA